jgi:hypothetical protein
MERVLAARWKPTANPKLTHAAKVLAIRKGLAGVASRAKVLPAERLAQLQKLTSDALAAVKPGQKKEAALLQETLRLAHASTMACALFHKDAEEERFDELVARVPQIDQTEMAKTDEPKKADKRPQQPAAKGVIVVGAQPRVIPGRLTPASPRDLGHGGHFCTVYAVSMKARHLYTIDLISSAFDSYLRLEDPRGVRLAEDDDGGGYPNARIVFLAPADGAYRVIATTFAGGAVGPYILRIQLGGFGRRPFGVPFPRPGMPIIKGGFGPAIPGVGPAPEEPKAEDKGEGELSLTDLANLASKQSSVRLAAFNSLAGTVTSDLAAPHAQKIARYLLLTVEPKSELEDVSAKLDSFAKCPQLLVALADCAAYNSPKQATTEAVVGGVLGQRLRFARDEDWRAACRKLLLQRALELSARPASGAGDQAAAMLLDLYKEQALVFGMEDTEAAGLTRPSRVLEAMIKHVAAKVGQKANLAAQDRQLLEQVGRQLQAVQLVADNDLEHMVLLQRIWIPVLSLYVKEQVPAQASAMLSMARDLSLEDKQSPSVLDQLRAGEQRILRCWALADNLK